MRTQIGCIYFTSSALCFALFVLACEIINDPETITFIVGSFLCRLLIFFLSRVAYNSRRKFGCSFLFIWRLWLLLMGDPLFYQSSEYERNVNRSLLYKALILCSPHREVGYFNVNTSGVTPESK